MESHQIALVQASFQQIAPIADTAASLFYDRLFEIAPEVKPLFHGDMAEQRRKLMATLAVAVNGLSDFASIAPAVQNLARRHGDYGVRPEHYPPVGAALLWTLRQGLGDGFTPEVEAAWAATYQALADVMIAAQTAQEAA